jgi:hypothetical protein
MGGLAGHMSHLYDNPELKFRDMEDILVKASSGNLLGTEKTDGQNIFISYSAKEGKAKAARNLGNIKTGGLDAAGLAAKFAGRGGLEKSFAEALSAFEKAVELLSAETQIEIFGPDANIWYNAEVQDPRTSNVINYDAKALTIHRVGHKEFDKQRGRPIDKDVSANADRLEKALDSVRNLIDNEDYRVEMNAVKNLRGLSDDKHLNFALSRLNNVLSKNGLSMNNTVADFLLKRVKKVVDSTLPEISEEIRQMVLRRLFKTPGVTLTKITKNIEDADQKEMVRKLIKREKEILTKAIFPIEDIVHDFSVEMLRGLESAFVLDNKAEVKRLKDEVARAIKAIEGVNNEKATEILVKQMKKLKDIENVSTAAEGFVFTYDGNAYKFTGNFAPINQLLGLFRYGRGDIPAMDINEQDVEDQPHKHKADVAFVPGSFKPPHVGHFQLMKDYLMDANKVVILISDPQSAKSIRFIDIPDANSKLEVSPDASKRIFDLYIENAGLGRQIEVWDIWNKGYNNPIQFLHDYIKEVGESGDKKTIALGVSTKDAGDEKRFNRFKADFADFDNLTLMNIPKEPLGSISATDMRNAVTDAVETGNVAQFQKYIPDGVSAEAVLNILADEQAWLTERKIKEMSAMSAGSVEGGGRPNDEETLIREEEDEMSEYMIDRKTFLEELAVREAIREKLQRKYQHAVDEEQMIREAIRDMLNEDVTEAPYKSTGINELETLLKKIVPVIEPDYKSLTTSEDQRESYRAHIIKAVQNALAPGGAVSRDSRDVKALDLPDEDTFDVGDVEEDIEIQMGEPDKFIDIDPQAKEEPEEKEEDFKIDGQEETGRNFAMMTWERIETNIVDSYRKLAASSDRDLFYDYLIANLKLYFDKFDDELAAVVTEPESEIYNDEKGV